MTTVSSVDYADGAVTQRRWLPVLGGVLLNLALGMFYGLSVFLLPLEKEFGWTRDQTSWVSTVGIVIIASTYIFAGKLYDKKGPRVVAIIGGLVYSLGYLLASTINSLTSFYLTLGMLLGIANGFGYVIPTAVASKWFPDRRGVMIGLMVGSYGAGSGIFGPLASKLMEHMDWRGVFRIYAAIFFVMTMIAASLLKNPPAGYRPPGWQAVRAAAAQQVDMPAAEMVRTPTFKFLWVAYCFGTTAGLMVISQLVPFARSAGYSAATAALAISVGALGNAAGRIFSGWLSDRAGRLNTLRGALIVSALVFPALYVMREQVIAFYILLAVAYYCYGTQLSVYACTSADFYGTKNIGLNYALLFTAWGIAGILGPILGGRVYVVTGDYRLAFFIAAGAEVIALIALAFARNPHRAVVPAMAAG